MGRKGVRRRRPGPAVRAPRFNGEHPRRWQLKRHAPGVYVIVDERGDNVLEHWDTTERRANVHLAKAAPVMQWALWRSYDFFDGFIREFVPRPMLCDHVLRLMADAMREAFPWKDGEPSTVAVVTLELQDNQGITEEAA